MVTFKPSAAGLRAGMLVITSGANIFYVSLRGTGVPPPPVFTGSLMGGLSPISGASVSLYAMGNTGYGSAPTQLATATSEGSGNFGIPPFTCPAGNPETYILALGGDGAAAATRPSD